MDYSNTDNKMDLTLQLATKDSLRPLIQLFLDKLTAVQWVKLESGSVDRDTKNAIMNMCLDIINIVSKYIYEALRQTAEGRDLRLTQSPPKTPSSSSGSDRSQKSLTISENQVQDCLGDTISVTFSEVMDVEQDGTCQYSKNLTELVVKEVTERVNSLASSKGAEPVPSRRLRAMGRQVLKILKSCASKMTCTSRSTNPQEDQLSQVRATEQNEELVGTGESRQTPPQKDKPKKVSSLENFVAATEAIKKILEEQASDITPMDDNISQEEYELLMSSNSQNTEDAASGIVRVLREELCEADGTPKSASKSEESSKTSCWKRVENKVQAFLAHKFAKEAIFSFVTKLKSKFDCFSSKTDKASIQQFIDGVDYLVEDMILPEDDQEMTDSTAEVCLYRKIARGISGSQRESISMQLSDIVSNHLNIGNSQKVQICVAIRTQVEWFMKLMWNWLMKQAQQLEKKRGRVSIAVKQIEGVVNLPAITEGLSIESDNMTPASEPAPASVIEEPAIDDEADEPSCEATDQPAAREATDQPAAREAPEQPAAREATEQPAAREATEQPAACQATATPVNRWDQLGYTIMVSWLVNQIQKNLSISLPSDSMGTFYVTLKEMLWEETVHSDISFSQRHIKRAAKAVYKDLCKKFGSAEVLAVAVLSQDPLMYKFTIETIKRHLMTPPKNSNNFIKTVFKTISKPFTACFKNYRKKPQTHIAPEKGEADGAGRENSPAGGQEEQGSAAVDTSYLDAPAGALPPHLAQLKNEGNDLFKHGQFGDALEKYTQAIDGCAEEARKKDARFTLLKRESNDLVKKGHFPEALEKYSECVTLKPDECALYTNRAICFLKLNRFEEAKQDCDSALQMEPKNKKAFYRRALAYKGLQDYLSASSDLQEVLQLDPNVREAEQELEVVTSLLRQSLMDNTPRKQKWIHRKICNRPNSSP